jgi:hypothetical protein
MKNYNPESFRDLQKKVFNLRVRNNPRDEDDSLVETSFDAEMSDSLIDWLNSIVIQLNMVNLDLGKLLEQAQASSIVNIKSLMEVPTIKTVDILKLLSANKPVKDFKSEDTDRLKIAEIKELLNSIEVLIDSLTRVGQQIETQLVALHRHQPPANGQAYIILPNQHNDVLNQKYLNTWRLMMKAFVAQCLTPIQGEVEVIKTKLEDMSLRGGGMCCEESYMTGSVNDLKYHPQYQMKEYY